MRTSAAAIMAIITAGFTGFDIRTPRRKRAV
jgi:hypothetical protein